MASAPIAPEDYMEPRCLLCDTPYGTPQAASVPLQRIAQKYDQLMESGLKDQARSHLLYWLNEAEMLHDQRGQFSLSNELMGHFRMTGQKDAALESARQALALLDEIDLGGTVSAATCYINCATVHQAFGAPEDALPLFERARELYERSLSPTDPRLGGLYNNMGLTCTSLGRYEQADGLFRDALQVMETVPGGRPEMAITLLNMADMQTAAHGAEAAEPAVSALLGRAAELLDTPEADPDGHYAWVCEKCAPVFRYYGWFAYAAELDERIKRCHERA